ncbi:DUF1656 domain-containing protein [Modicisalibacter tunisiensis]|uniref:DUF1656 domain-containing protein n=1 Tax=Modicisalibacter tunisiensis TaxID=390637 RepID=A0ABS7WWR6_9GAMM|nr:DUF1656 domain-containing protein [Modicisalibacter tunisiensis]MBZ9539533.1 DUF1656 domain-containing protein [Modicisalibacter tunisiensis]MBZ9567064.1 DUF1656 domain-containing protein [Modicisalibacter tunisiensis]
MLAEWSLLGFLVPPLALPVLLALALYLLVKRLLTRLRLYHWFWHPLLLDVALYILLLWAVLSLSGALPIGDPATRG